MSGTEGQKVERAMTSGKIFTPKENTEKQNDGSNGGSNGDQPRELVFKATNLDSGDAQQTTDKEQREQLTPSGEVHTATTKQGGSIQIDSEGTSMPWKAIVNITSDQTAAKEMGAELQPGGCDKEPETQEEMAVVTDQLGNAGTGQAMGNNAPGHQNAPTTSMQTTDNAKVTNASTNKGTMNEGGENAMEVDKPQKNAEEQATNSGPTQGRTHTEAQQTVAAGLPKTKTMISYYKWRKKHHIGLNSVMRQAVGETDRNSGLSQSSLSSSTGTRTPHKC